METLVFTLIATLIAAAVTGLTFIAYKHLKGYHKIFNILLPISIIAPVVIIAANLGGAHESINHLAKELSGEPNQPIQEVSFSITNLQQNKRTVIITLAVGVAVIGYLTFLFFLPRILGADDSREKEQT